MSRPRRFPLRAQREILGLYRIVVGVLFTCHGAADLFGVLGGSHQNPGQALPFASWPGWWAAAIQLTGGLLVTVGIGSRITAVVCSGSMAYAYFSVHQPVGLLPLTNGGETAALFCWAFLLVGVLGPGRWALDNVLTHRGVEASSRPEVE